MYTLQILIICLFQQFTSIKTQQQVDEERSQCIINDIKSTKTFYPTIIPKNTTKFQIIGLFPAMVPLKKRFNRSGFVWFEVAKYAIDQVNKILSKLQVPTVLELIAYDTCNSVEIAMSALLENLLPSTDNQTCSCEENENRILGIVGPASSATVDVVEKFLSFDRFPVVSYSATSVSFDNKELYPMFMRTIPPDNLQAKMIVDVLIHFKWNFVSIIANDNEYGRMGSHELKRLFAMHGICIAYENSFAYPLMDSEIDEIVHGIKNQPQSQVIILWASGLRSQKFLNHMSIHHTLHHKTWIVTESVGTNPAFINFNKNTVQGMLSIVPYAGVYEEFDEHFKTLDYTNNATENIWLRNFFENHLKLNDTQLRNATVENFWYKIPTTKNGYVRNAIYTYANAIKNYVTQNTVCTKNQTCTVNQDINRKDFFTKYLQNVTIKTLTNDIASFHTDGNINITHFHLYALQPGEDQVAKHTNLAWKKLGDWDQGKGIKINSSIIWARNSVEVPYSACSKTCNAGEYAVAHDSCCWTCIECDVGYIKSDVGRHPCQMCPLGTVANKNHTYCVNIEEKYLKHDTTQAKVLYISIAIISMTILFFQLIFIIYRKTPIVVSSQFHASLLQMTSLLVLALCIILVTIKPSQVTCTARICTIGVFLSMAYISTLLKTQRLIFIFQSDSIVTRKKKRTALSVEIGTVAVIISINIVLLLVFYILKPFNIEISNVKNGVQVLDCNTTLPFFAQIIYVMCLAITCGIQAFRARRLPQNYNETRLITFAMFSSCTVLIIIFPLYASATNMTDAAFIGSLLILVADFIVLVFMYSYKIFIILARPHMNCSEAFHKMRLQSIERRVSRDMERRKRSQSVESLDILENYDRDRSSSALSLSEQYGSLRINTHAAKRDSLAPPTPRNMLPNWMKRMSDMSTRTEEKSRSNTVMSDVSVSSSNNSVFNVTEDETITRNFSISQIEDIYY